jgi:hypothetical protein
VIALATIHKSGSSRVGVPADDRIPPKSERASRRIQGWRGGVQDPAFAYASPRLAGSESGPERAHAYGRKRPSDSKVDQVAKDGSLGIAVETGQFVSPLRTSLIEFRIRFSMQRGAGRWLVTNLQAG